jgi:hypothetical protein
LSSAQDCNSNPPNPGSGICCLEFQEGGSVQGDAEETPSDGSSDGPNADSGLCMISASNYDQSCTVDTDCSMVSSGDYCSATCLCGGSAINVGALAKFNADVAKTPLGSGALGNVFCGCPFSWGPCCRHGTCVGERGGCSSPSDSLPACADAGGTCMPFGSCGQPGPPDACAYSDEMCCVP